MENRQWHYLMVLPCFDSNKMLYKSGSIVVTPCHNILSQLVLLVGILQWVNMRPAYAPYHFSCIVLQNITKQIVHALCKILN